MVQTAAGLVPPELRTRFVSTLVSGVNILRLGADEDVNKTPLAWWSLGGSAPMMAVRLAAEGAEVSLAARLSDRERSHLPHCIKSTPSIEFTVLCSNHSFSVAVLISSWSEQ